MAQLIIRVGAAADRSLTEVWRPAIDSANKAKAAIEKAAKATADSNVRVAKAAVAAEAREKQNLVKAAEKARREEVRAAEKSAKDQQYAVAKAAKSEASEAEKLAAAKARIRDRSAAYAGQLAAKQAAEEARAAAKTTRDLEREMDKRKRAAAQASRDAYAGAKHMASINAGEEKYKTDRIRAMGSGASKVASFAGRGISAAGGMALGVANDLARGAGVDLDFGSMAQKNFELNKSAQDIANSGYMAGDRRNGMRVTAGELSDDAFRVGKRTGMSADDAMSGLGDFVGKTGDLATGRDILSDMAKLSKATGTNLSDMMSAAGGVAMAMGDTENKGDKLNQIMNSFAAQGKLGAVEIKNLATQMDKLSAQAGQFEGNLADNMVMMGTLAQEARQRGGAASATQAATSVAAFTSMLKTPKRAEEFEKATGKKVFNAQGMLRNPQEIILEALRAKGMDPTGFKSIFANAQGGRAVEGFATMYRQAGGGKAGEAAVTAEFERLKAASIDAAEAQESFALAMKQPKAQAEIFNQTLRETVMKVQNELTPALVAIAPAIVEGAKALAAAVAWMTGSSPIASQVSDASSKVSSAVAANEAGIKSGTVNAGQEQVNFLALSEATRAQSAAKADLEEKRKAEKPSGAMGIAASIFDQTKLGTAFSVVDRFAGSGKGNNLSETITAGRHKDTVAAEGRAGEADAMVKQAKEASEKLHNLLATGVVKVKIEGGSVGPPPVNEAGRTPGPGQ